jgi:hypothetical protein
MILSSAGNEFLVNTWTDDNQNGPSVAGLEGGGFVVTWTSSGQPTGATYGVYGQRYALDGAAVGSEFQVNTFDTSGLNYDARPSVAALEGGGFVVSWTSSDVDSNIDTDVFCQRFAADGSKVGVEVLVDTPTMPLIISPSVAGIGGWRLRGVMETHR